MDLDRGEFSILPSFQLPGPCAHGESAEFSTKAGLWECGTDAIGWQPANVIVVAKSGGDYTSIQAALDSISDAVVDNPYLVWIGPGVYDEQVTMAPYVHLQGAGQGITVISKADGSVTLRLAAYTSLRDLTVLNSAAYSSNHAILAAASDNVTGTLVANVEARALGSGDWSQGCTLEGSDTSVTLVSVTIHAEGGSSLNYGLKVRSGATAILQAGSFTASGGSVTAYAIYTHDAGTTLEATDIRAVAENPVGGSRGLYNGGIARLRGGLYAAHGGHTIYGIHNSGSVAILVAESVTAEALDAASTSRGLVNADGASATLHGGSFTARGGDSSARGLYLYGTSSVLEANGISVRAEDGNLKQRRRPF